MPGRDVFITLAVCEDDVDFLRRVLHDGRLKAAEEERMASMRAGDSLRSAGDRVALDGSAKTAARRGRMIADAMERISSALGAPPPFEGSPGSLFLPPADADAAGGAVIICASCGWTQARAAANDDCASTGTEHRWTLARERGAAR